VHRWTLVAALVLASCGDVTAPDSIDPSAAALDAMVDVRASGCGPRIGFGTATLIDEGLALTAAHVVAGADTITVIDLAGDEHAATVVWFDPDLDLAALTIPTEVGRPVPLHAEGTDDTDRGVVAVSRGAFDGRVVSTATVEIPRHVDVRTTDIYLDDDVVRPGFEITGDIEPGDSGTMVITADGAAGVVWSRSNTTAGRAWAVDVPDDFRRDDFRSSLDTEVDLGNCLP